MQSVTLKVRVSALQRFFIARKQVQLGGIPKYHQSVSLQVPGLKEAHRIRVENIIYLEGGEILVELEGFHPGTHANEGLDLDSLYQSFNAAQWVIAKGGIQDEPIITSAII